MIEGKSDNVVYLAIISHGLRTDEWRYAKDPAVHPSITRSFRLLPLIYCTHETEIIRHSCQFRRSVVSQYLSVCRSLRVQRSGGSWQASTMRLLPHHCRLFFHQSIRQYDTFDSWYNTE